MSEAQQRVIARLMRESIDYAFTHRNEALAYAQLYGRGLDAKRTDQFVSMYVNHWTEDCGERGRQAMVELLKRAAEAGLIPRRCEPEFVG